MAGLLEIPLERHTLSIDRGDLREQKFLEIAPLAQVPVLQIDENTHLGESMAILFYLAQESSWWPSETLDQARVLTWLSFEQERHMKPLAQLRLHLALHKDRDPASEEFQRYAAEARTALQILDEQLARQGPRGWVATTEHPSIADIALYPYTKMSPLGGIDLSAYQNVSGWLLRIEQIDGYQSLFPNEPSKVLSTVETAP